MNPWIFLLLIPWAGATWLVYWLATLPWRRSERGRLFLEILGLGLREGKSVDVILGEACATRDRSIPVRMHWVAANLEGGKGLRDAMDQAGGFLSPDVRATLGWGLDHGYLDEAVVLCRERLEERPTASHGGILGVAILLMLPCSTAGLLLFLWVRVFPIFAMVIDATAGGILPARWAPISWWIEHGWVPASLALAAEGLVCVAACGRTLGPWSARVLPLDRIESWLPWVRPRIQRRFVQLLTAGLDLGLGEPEAVVAAGAGTGNAVWRRRSGWVADALRRGERLDAAIGLVDPTPEFRWRMSMALRRNQRAASSVRGWADDLEARAARNEMMAAQSMLTFVVLANALLVAFSAIAVYGLLAQLMDLVEFL